MSDINNFHMLQGEPLERPLHFYGLGVEAGGVTEETGHEGEFLILDLIGAQWFAERLEIAAEGLSSPRWQRELLLAPVAALEVNSRRWNGRSLAREWGLAEGQWYELILAPDAAGGGQLYRNLFGEGQPVRIEKGSGLPDDLIAKLSAAVSLSGSVATSSRIRSLIPTGTIEHLCVYDVGQGLAQGVLGSTGTPIAYADFGGGVMADTATWPSTMTGFCFSNSPPIVLSHWHYDHFSAANRFPVARSMNWIAPNQTLGPGPQSTFASALIAAGTLHVWPGATKSLTSGQIAIELCTGANQNTSGLALVIAGPSRGNDPIILTGDAGYFHIPSLAAGTSIHAFVVPHHGGAASGKAAPDPGNTSSRVVISCGPGNSYGHPLGASLTKLTSAGWSLGSVGGRIDDRYSEDLRPLLGHIGMRWRGTMPVVTPCGGCACSISPAAAQW
jgi:hypothetical protein